jgi:7-cyano-7-deazaguanine synthase
LKTTSWEKRLGEDHVIDLGVIAEISDTALTRPVEIEMTKSGLPNTFVPGRNLLFLAVAGALAYRRGIDVLVGGMCETDFSGYPDCREATVRAMQSALALGLDRRMRIETPLMWIDKAATWQLARDLGGDALVQLIIEETHTCYLGERGEKHRWGHGCGTCPACALRRAGYEQWAATRS